MDDFLLTMINTVKYDSQFEKERDELITILGRARINKMPRSRLIQPQRRMNQKYEDIEIRVPVPLLDQANDSNTFFMLRKLVKYVYQESDNYGLGDVLIRPSMMSEQDVECPEHDVFFSDIQNTVIQGIRDARYSIWGAMAWLSNRAIINELIEKKKQGVCVRLVISEEKSNRPYYSELSQNFDVVTIPHFGRYNDNLMHDKFCIIDFEYVMHGTFNWTGKAEYNDETLATAVDRTFVKKFSDEFMRLYRKGTHIS